MGQQTADGFVADRSRPGINAIVLLLILPVETSSRFVLVASWGRRGEARAKLRVDSRMTWVAMSWRLHTLVLLAIGTAAGRHGRGWGSEKGLESVTSNCKYTPRRACT